MPKVATPSNARPPLRRVVVIEDSVIHFEVLELRLRAEYPGLEDVQCLDSPLDLLERIAAFGPDLVITDYHMPGYDVLATLTALRQRWPRLPVLVMSGQVGEERAVQLLKAGASDFLPKARLEQLARVIDRELAESQAQTDKARLQQQLDNQRLLNQAVIDQVPVGLWMTSPDGTVLHASQCGAELMSDLGALHDDGLHAVGAWWVDTGQPMEPADAPAARAIGQGQALPARLARVLDKDGRERFLSCAAAPLLAQDGSSLGAVVTALDLTSEVQLRERLRQAEMRVRQLSQNQSESHELQMANLSRELHDNLGQVLSLLKLHLGAAARRDLPSARRKIEIDQALPLVDMALSRLREVCGDLWPSELRDFGLGPALASVCSAAARASGMAVSCNETGRAHPLAASSLLGLFRVGQQAVTNALRHSSAAAVQLELDWQDNTVSLTITDDGTGFDTAAACLPTQHGLRGMRERIELLGGTLRIDSRPGHGTVVQASLPARVGEKT